MDILLNDLNWKVKGYWPYIPFLGRSLEVGNELMGVTDWMDAVVPGGVHQDLQRAGLIEDPYFELNSLKCEWVENRWWMYKTEFFPEQALKNRLLSLIFKGVDYKAHFYLNHEKLGAHEGMFETVCFDITDKVRFDGKNELIVLLENVPEEMGQIGYTSKTKTQKSRFNYKWDFSTRMVNLGIWDDVILKASGKLTFRDTFVSTEVRNDMGVIRISTCLNGNTDKDTVIKIRIDHEDGVLSESQEVYHKEESAGRFKKEIFVKKPALWYPNGLGGQPMYRVRLEVYEEQVLSDEEEYHTGIRQIRYERNEGQNEETLPYTFVINGSPVYIKGVNLVPFDMLYGNVTKEIYDRYIRLIKAANINMVRVWGGGIIEKEYFYQLCDKNGILVWQEFIQSSSGIDNMPSEDAQFLKLLKASAVQAVKLKRNHVSHTVWSGGNELTDENGVPATDLNLNIGTLKEIVSQYDAGKLFLPTSASGPNEFLSIDQAGRNHDVHGGWKYEGVEMHYRKFNQSDCLFHSEVGVDGCSSVKSLQKFLGSANLQVATMADNLVWRHHGEWWDTLERDEGIFGKFETLEQFSQSSQLIQAEGIRYIVESNRRRKFHNSGTMLWQFNEPWPNVSCTSLVDYYGTPKMAYYWVKKAFNPIHVSMRYDKLIYSCGEEFRCEIYLHNSLEEQELLVEYEIRNVQGRVIERWQSQICSPKNSVKKVTRIKTDMEAQPNHLFFVRLRIYDSKGNEAANNIYLFSQKGTEIYASLLTMKKTELVAEKIDEGYCIRNTSDTVYPFVHCIASEPEEKAIIDDNYVCIFPGEQHVFKFEAMNGTGDVTAENIIAKVYGG